MSNFKLTYDVSSEDDSPAKLRFAWYASLDEAVMQAEHELATDDAIDRHREHYRNEDLQLHTTGVRIVSVEDADGKVVWTPTSN